MEISDQAKKIILAIIFILIVIALGAAIYLLFFRPLLGPAGGPISTGTPADIGGLPPSGPGTGQIAPDGDTRLPLEPDLPLPAEEPSPIALGGLTETKKLSDDPVLGAKLAAGGDNINYYNPGDNKFYRLDRFGRAVALSEQEFYNVKNVTWSNVSDRAVIEYPDGAKIAYDFKAERQVTLPSHWESFDFSKNQDSLSMKIIGLDPNNRYLAVSDHDGSNVKAIEPIGLNVSKVTPTWSSNDQVVALYSEGIGFERQELYFVGQNNENFKSLVVEGRGFEHLWSPSGNMMLYSTYTSENELKPSLWIVGSSGDNIGQGRKSLNIDTWASKCAYHRETEVYCAVPAYLPEGAGFVRDLAAGIPDNIYQIDPISGAKKLIAVPDGEYRMEDLMVDREGNYLYFVDRFTSSLHQIRLK